MVPDLHSTETVLTAIAIFVVSVVLLCCMKCRRKSNDNEDVTRQNEYKLHDIIEDESYGVLSAADATCQTSTLGELSESDATSQSSSIQQTSYEGMSPIQRLEKLYNDEVLNILHTYFQLKIIESSTWDIFREERLHELFHCFKQRTLCCNSSLSSTCSSIQRYMNVGEEQFFLLYQEDPSIPAIHEVKNTRGYITQHCICPFSPNTGTEISNLDITLICILMKTCVRTPAGHPQWFQDVKQIRNKLFHRGVDSSISDQHIREWRKTLEEAVINIAGTICSEYQKGVKRRFTEQTKKDSQIDEIKQTVRDEILRVLDNHSVLVDPKFPTNRYPQTTSSVDSSCLKDQKKIIVEWKFYDGGHWDVDLIQTELMRIKSIGDFTIDFVYKGCLCVQSRASMYLLSNSETLNDAVEEFLVLFVKFLKLDAGSKYNVDVILSVWFPGEQLSINDNFEEPVRTSEAQIPIKQPKLLTKATLIKQIDVSGMLTDCTYVDETFIISDTGCNRLIICDANSDNVRYIHMSEKPWKITAIDNTTVAVEVSVGNIQIIDFINSETIRTFYVICRFIVGLFCYDDHLYVGNINEEIYVFDLYGKIIRHINTKSVPFYLTVDNNYIVYTDDKNKLFCSSLTGEDLMVCEISMISKNGGLTTGIDGNIYVIGYFSHNVVVATPDGKQFRQLLSESDGLKFPKGICYNRTLKTLMVCNEHGPAFLYEIKK